MIYKAFSQANIYYHRIVCLFCACPVAIIHLKNVNLIIRLIFLNFNGSWNF